MHYLVLQKLLKILILLKIIMKDMVYVLMKEEHFRKEILIIIFGVHESSLVHANNKANNIYVMGNLFVQGINDTTLYAEKIYSQNFTQSSKTFILSLHYNGNDTYLFVNGAQELKFKAKDDQIINEKLCLRNLSSEFC